MYLFGILQVMKVFAIYLFLSSFSLSAVSASCPVFSDLERNLLTSVIANEQSRKQMEDALEQGELKKALEIQHNCLVAKQQTMHNWSTLLFVAICFGGVGFLAKEISNISH
jgi:hypothetical protein